MCERYGDTLAICPQTRRLVEKHISSFSDPLALDFLQISVGYVKSDVTGVLGATKAGVGFLALSAALLSTMDDYDAAVVFEHLLDQSTTDKSSVPSALQLKALMSIMDHKLNRLGFTNSVLG